MDKVTEDQIDAMVAEYKKEYDFNAQQNEETFFNNQVRYQAKIEIALEKFLSANNYHAFTSNFEDLHNLEQLPGLACQHLMSKGYGFAGEGD
ncbi:hypothetical protein Zmor_004310 [Zophobas morio]|uniref:L-arabinose isomerase central domain-containing protein n=1 Tax=Zophobas morio TaxID=2755281 RepID=A0AA38HI43_9CUCU|nr:hypothetical protein Zmor_004310 [Zophobas morio]